MFSNSWQPDQTKVDKEAEKLKKMYVGRKGSIANVPKEYEEFFQDFAKISVFLQNDNVVLKQLEVLNALLVDEAKTRQLFVDNDEKKRGYLSHKKVLRNVLEQELAKIGFQRDLGKAIDLLNPSTFASTFKDGLLLKDPGAGVEHGEFTHAIQWLIIGWQHKDTPFLSRPIIKIYNQLGDDERFSVIWDAVIDLFPTVCKDSRCPERLLSLILQSNDPNLSLLKTLSQSRVTKRNLGKQAPTLFPETKTYPKKEYIASQDKNLLLPKK